MTLFILREFLQKKFVLCFRKAHFVVAWISCILLLSTVVQTHEYDSNAKLGLDVVSLCYDHNNYART